MKKSELKSVDDALAEFLSFVEPIGRTVMLTLEEADDRILARNVVAPMDYPHYDQCILDGYAVRTEDLAGCGENNSRPLSLVVGNHVNGGCCTLVHTGDAFPAGADALLPLEDASEENGYVLASKEVTEGQWIWPKGGGLARGELVVREGHQLKPIDIAMLAKVGIDAVEVYDRPSVLILPTGDECINRGKEVPPGFVYETNGLMVSLLVKRYGGSPTLHDVVPDDQVRLEKALTEGTHYDLIVTIGGSSGSKRDLMEEVVSSIGEALFHGVALHPGNHMGTGVIKKGEKQTAVIFSPGYTESCAVAAFVFGEAAVRRLGHFPASLHAGYQAQLTGDLSVRVGIRGVRKVNIQNGKAKPIKMLGETHLPGNYGYVVVPEDRAGFDAGESVEVLHFE
ncbi:MAG TPA: molybdopterin molybdotransferase MoeA [Syntrophorhabdaceae bacterium]|nr:molybdopterin molybdotransferase MoeA [Syntrophorhabdaceae bacterium]